MKTKLGRQEAQLLAYAHLQKRRTIATGDLTGPLGLSRQQERELFRRMARGGLIARVRPGLYLVPPRLPLGGAWSPDEALALNALMRDCLGRYQICGPNAFNHYGFDEQVPTRVYAYNNRLSGQRCIGAVALSLIKVDERRLGATERVSTPEGDQAIYSSRPRTLVDAVHDWSRFDSLPRAFQWIRAELDTGRVTPEELIRLARRYANQGTRRRIGAVLEQLGAPAAALARLQASLTCSKALIPWVPVNPKRGRVNRRWGVVLNDET